MLDPHRIDTNTQFFNNESSTRKFLWYNFLSSFSLLLLGFIISTPSTNEGRKFTTEILECLTIPWPHHTLSSLRLSDPVPDLLPLRLTSLYGGGGGGLESSPQVHLLSLYGSHGVLLPLLHEYHKRTMTIDTYSHFRFHDLLRSHKSGLGTTNVALHPESPGRRGAMEPHEGSQIPPQSNSNDDTEDVVVVGSCGDWVVHSDSNVETDLGVHTNAVAEEEDVGMKNAGTNVESNGSNAGVVATMTNVVGVVLRIRARLSWPWLGSIVIVSAIANGTETD